jgi:CHAD domain-containing protein
MARLEGPAAAVRDAVVIDGGADAERGGAPASAADTFYDTNDFRLGRWSCSLRHRSGDGWYIVVPVPDKNDPVERRVVRFDGRPGTIPSAARGALHPLTRGAALSLIADPIDATRSLGPPDICLPVLRRRPSGREVIHAAIAGSARMLILHLPAALLGDDSEGVHQARVATRRLRSDLRTFATMLDPAWTSVLRAELQWLAGALGAVRDADVLLRRINDTIKSRPLADPTAAAEVVAVLEAQRAAAGMGLATAIGSRRALALYELVVAAAADPPTNTRAVGSALRRLAPLVRRPWRHLQRQVAELGDTPSDEQLHRVRLLAKRARYAAEAVSPAFGPEARRFASAMAAIQDELGELHDLAVAAAWSTETAVQLERQHETPAAQAALVIADRFVSQHTELHPTWRKAYRRASRHRNRDWIE